jgi:PAS domain S-box-containing protein
MKILIVDDNNDDRKMLRYVLETHGHDVMEACNGQEGLQTASAHRLDLIISDVFMPVMDGFQFLRNLRGLCSVPFVFYSAVYDSNRDKQLAASLGADGYIIKPKDPVEFMEDIGRIVGEGVRDRFRGIEGDAEYLKKYSQVVVSKLEEKVRELEETLAERTRAEEALKESEARYRALFEESIDGVFITSIEGKIIDISNTGVNILGYDSKEEMLRLDLSRDLYMDPKDRRRILSEVIEKGFHEYEVFLKKKSGEKMPVRCAMNAVREADGAIIAYRGVIRDITEQKRLEQELFKAKKLEIIGQLAGGVAHEVRNPLNAILSISEALFREIEIVDNPEYLPYILHIRTQVGRLSKLMTDLLDLGRAVNPAAIQPVSLVELFAETIHLWNMTEKAEANPVVFIREHEICYPLVNADGARLQQVLINLIENAAQHSPPGSEIILKIQETVGQKVTILVSDAGKGIAPEKLEKVFEPFFTTRSGGTGLGLSLVKHFIESMGGEARIMNNVPPPGCTAELVLRIASEGGETAHETENSIN